MANQCEENLSIEPSPIFDREHSINAELVKHCEEQSNIEKGFLCVVLQTTPEFLKGLEKLKNEWFYENWSDLILSMVRRSVDMKNTENEYQIHINESLKIGLKAAALYLRKSESEILSGLINERLNGLKKDLDVLIGSHL